MRSDFLFKLLHLRQVAPKQVGQYKDLAVLVDQKQRWWLWEISTFLCKS